MQSWKLPPLDSRVTKYVECYWMLKKEQDDAGYAHPKLNPDPATHLILADANQKHQYTQGTSSYEGRGSHWILPHCKTFVMDHSQPFQILGIKLHVGALYALNAPFPTTDLDTILNVDMDNLFNTHSLSLSGLLAKATNEPKKVCTIMDEVLGPLLLGGHEDKYSQIVSSALPLLTDTPVSEIGAALHCSQRTIERSFLRVTKLTLKQYQTMTRLETMLEYMSQLDGSQLNWAEIAVNFGFSDQPHLIRYLKSSIGTTPGAYAKQRDLTIDVYGDFE